MGGRLFKKKPQKKGIATYKKAGAGRVLKKMAERWASEMRRNSQKEKQQEKKHYGPLRRPEGGYADVTLRNAYIGIRRRAKGTTFDASREPAVFDLFLGQTLERLEKPPVYKGHALGTYYIVQTFYRQSVARTENTLKGLWMAKCLLGKKSGHTDSSQPQELEINAIPPAATL